MTNLVDEDIINTINPAALSSVQYREALIGLPLNLKGVLLFRNADHIPTAPETFPALIDTQASIRDSYKITGVPETFIIDKKGILVKKVIGPLDWASPEILRYIRKLIQEPYST